MLNAGNSEEHGDHRCAAHQAADPRQTVGSRAPLDQPGDEEQRGLHDDVVNDVEDRAGNSGEREQREPEDHVADVADDVERQHPPQVVLGECSEHADDHREPGEHEQQRSLPGVRREHERLRADDRVHPDLGEQPGEDRRDRSGCGGIAVGQPEEQREEPGLDAEHEDQQQREPGRHAGRQLGHPLGELRHVHRAGGRVDHCERRDEERRGDEADDDVRHAGADLVRRARRA